jgi:hypothetical protein
MPSGWLILPKWTATLTGAQLDFAGSFVDPLRVAHAEGAQSTGARSGRRSRSSSVQSASAALHVQNGQRRRALPHWASRMLGPTRSHLRGLLGVLGKEWFRYERALRSRDRSYLSLHNRDECLEAAPNGEGFRCDWQWCSDLHAPKLMPSLGLRLIKRALLDHPIESSKKLIEERARPDISFVIGHRGISRLPHLLATLESIAAQRNAAVECIVVEQDDVAQLRIQLPDWVRYIHTPPPVAEMPYCRSWAFNVGARQARGQVLVLHDNDMLVPADYAFELLDRIRDGYEVVNLKRFIFYLSEAHTRTCFDGLAGPTDRPPEAITQNLEGGGSVAVTREAYERIGGMDEQFVGWGGEDNEFWSRAQTLRVWSYANLPIVHLWHGAQPGKHQLNNPTVLRHHELSLIPVENRIDRLRSLPAGLMSGPFGFGQGDQ